MTEVSSTKLKFVKWILQKQEKRGSGRTANKVHITSSVIARNFGSFFTCFHQVAEDSRLADLQNSGFSIHGTHQVDPPSPSGSHLVLLSKTLDLDVAPGFVADTEEWRCRFGFEGNLPKGAMHSG